MTNKNINNIELEEKDNHVETFAKTVFTTFTTVFIAELGDKTQIATLLLSAGSGKPLIVFIGAALALICTSLIGVGLGQWLSQNIPEKIINSVAGCIMVGIGLYLITEISIPGFYIPNFL